MKFIKTFENFKVKNITSEDVRKTINELQRCCSGAIFVKPKIESGVFAKRIKNMLKQKQDILVLCNQSMTLAGKLFQLQKEK